ncbi:uncharacterized protein LOC141718010 [Apium graveolens]|uniref:uncharacterized protein LOC141718010 n=1 Tax=Apium graveolens TaxID=4045 RepID=UPI003D78CEF8
MRYKEHAKRPVCDDTDFKDPTEKPCVQAAATGDGSSRPLYKGLWACKVYVEKLSAELERVLKLGEVSDPEEVIRLRGEVKELKIAKGELEKSLDEVSKKNDFSATQIFDLLTKKSGLMAECGALEVSLRDTKLEVEGLNAALGASKDSYVEKEAAWIAEKAELIMKLDCLEFSLARCQDEVLKLIEEGYGECMARLGASGVYVNGHGFDAYLVDVGNKVQAGKGASASSRAN